MFPAFISSCLHDFLHLFYPHHCEGCGTDALETHALLCGKCSDELPSTYFFNLPGNPVEKSFYGRLAVAHAGATYYFTKESLLQHLLVQLKYKNNREAGYFLGRMMGYALAESPCYHEIDALVPLPLHPKKAYQRGYNQAELLCMGISEVWNRPVISHAVVRSHFTETQTKQNRVSRWHNMEGVFCVTDPGILVNKHLLLVDDVITTGATLEACGSLLLQVPGTILSLAAAAYTI